MTTESARSFESAADFATFVSEGWNAHGNEPEKVAAALFARLSSFPTDEHGAGALRLGEHVCVSHLGDVPALERMLAGLPAGFESNEVCATSVRRARWVLANLNGQAAPEIADRFRWAGMQNLWSIWIRQGRAEQVSAMLAVELPRALADQDPMSRRSLAATCNNLAFELRDGVRGDAVRQTVSESPGRGNSASGEVPAARRSPLPAPDIPGSGRPGGAATRRGTGRADSA